MPIQKFRAERPISRECCFILRRRDQIETVLARPTTVDDIAGPAGSLYLAYLEKLLPSPFLKIGTGAILSGILEKMRSHLNEGQASASDHQWRLKLLRAAEHIKSKARSRRLLRLARPRYSLRS